MAHSLAILSRYPVKLDFEREPQSDAVTQSDGLFFFCESIKEVLFFKMHVLGARFVP